MGGRVEDGEAAVVGGEVRRDAAEGGDGALVVF